MFLHKKLGNETKLCFHGEVLKSTVPSNTDIQSLCDAMNSYIKTHEGLVFFSVSDGDLGVVVDLWDSEEEFLENSCCFFYDEYMN